MIRHLGSALTDVTYIFDEPTVGLHPHDVARMNRLLLRLRDKGNTVLVVEHEPEVIAIADHVVDLGPGAGPDGGTVCFEGTVDGLRASDTLTGRHLGYRAALKPATRTPAGTLEIRNATRQQPAGRERGHPARRAVRGHRRGRIGQELADPRLDAEGRGGRLDRPGADQGLAAQQPGHLHRAAGPDPDGLREGERRQARAVQRELRGRLPGLQRQRRHLHVPRLDGRDRRRCARNARASGSRPACWSTSSPGGTSARCSRCRSAEALEFFGSGEAKTPAARTVLGRMADVGLGYLRLGQPLTTLSGGERQRLKLAIQMATDGGIYVLDEPTSGLHLADVEHLLGLLDRLVDAGKSVIVIEHHLAVMAHADWIIDLGPGAGHDGGRVVFDGLPADLVAARSTLTGQHLADYVG